MRKSNIISVLFLVVALTFTHGSTALCGHKLQGEYTKDGIKILKKWKSIHHLKCEMDVYQSPSISMDSSTLMIQTENPSGISFVLHLDKTKKYRFSITGRQVKNSLTLRISKDNRPAEYIPAPQQKEVFTIDGTSKVELLFYSDTKAEYHLLDFSFSECKNCFTDKDLITKINKKYPQLEERFKNNTLALAKVLLDFASNTADYGDSYIYESSYCYYKSAADIFSVYKQNTRGDACGAFAIFLRKVLALYGIQALEIGFGYKDDLDLIHVANVIAIPHEKGHRFYLFDATYNAYYADKYGNPVEFSTLISSSATRSLYTFVTRDIHRDYHIESDSLSRKLVVNNDNRCNRLYNGMKTITKCHSMENSFEATKNTWLDILTKKQITTTDPYLSLLKHSVIDISCPDPRVRNEFIRVLNEAGVPFRTQ